MLNDPARANACPTCGAEPGQPCWSKVMHQELAAIVHTARRKGAAFPDTDAPAPLEAPHVQGDTEPF